MPTTILDGESYPQALARRYAEEAATDARLIENATNHKESDMGIKNAEFVDAQEMHRTYPDTFYAPSAEELAAIKVGDSVKVCAWDERFWVEVTGVFTHTIRGRVDNDLICTESHGLMFGDLISFHRNNVYNIL